MCQILWPVWAGSAVLYLEGSELPVTWQCAWYIILLQYLYVDNLLAWSHKPSFASQHQLLILLRYSDQFILSRFEPWFM